MALVDLRTSDVIADPAPLGPQVENDADEEARAAAIAAAGNAAIAVAFPRFNDGRGFTQARLLRESHGYEGELRATGAVIPDQALHLLRVGFDTVEVPGPQTVAHWTDALSRYRGAYQTALRNPAQLRRNASLEQAARLDCALRETGSIRERIRLLADRVPGRLAFSTSLSIEDQAVLHGIVAAGVAVDVFTLDTGRLFAETLETLAETEARFGIRIRVISPERQALEDLVARQGIFGFRDSVSARQDCCHVRKVAPLTRALEGSAAWITGLRSGQSTSRDHVPLAEWDAGRALLKVSPLGDWSLEQVEAYVAEHRVPTNPLHARGFPSIGCQPCTRAITAGEDIRAGRWWWEQESHKECGLHPAGPAGGAS